MRSSILYLLKNAVGYLSSEEMARRLNVSCAVVCEHIQELEAAGYQIEKDLHRGYRLLKAAKDLLPDEVKYRLQTKWLGHELRYYMSVDSTNQLAKQLYNEGMPDGSVVISEEQTGGKGRLSRGWFSPKEKGLWFSVLLKPPFLPQEAPKCTLLAAVAIARAIEKTTGIRCGIKWPNDILYDGRKLVGILTEMSAALEGIHYIVIGMGINVNLDKCDYPEELRDIAVSLKMIRGAAIERSELLVEVIRELEGLYEAVCQNGFAAVLEAWRSYSVTLGQEVRVIGIEETFTGLAVDIDESGALLIERSDGEIEKVLAGDVSIRPKK